MKKTLILLVAVMLPALAATGAEWRVQDADYQTLGYVNADGEVLDTGYQIIGYLESDLVKNSDFNILARLEQGEDIMVKNPSFVTQYYIELGEGGTGRLKDRRFNILARYESGRISSADDAILAYYDYDNPDTPGTVEGMGGEEALLFLLYFSELFD
ncbi:MAG TPA: hypothetical protein ENN88_00955 [Candidatus Coatesbacteria bacterium]|nr:hypothetical protein [Candidatus Coatesbacteria bacterium]